MTKRTALRPGAKHGAKRTELQWHRGAPQGLLLTVEQFNALIPIGTPVRYFPVSGDAHFVDTKTRSVAWTVGDHASVLVDGIVGTVAVSFLELRPSASPAPLPAGPDAATLALDAIAKATGCTQWDYPGQLVRDVQELVAERDRLAVRLLPPSTEQRAALDRAKARCWDTSREFQRASDKHAAQWSRASGVALQLASENAAAAAAALRALELGPYPVSGEDEAPC